MRHEAAAIVAALALWVAGCARPAGPPAIALGTPCVACGMDIQDLRFACAREVDRRWRVYDSIECLLRDIGTGPSAGVYLADYDHQTLHAAESLWVVRGEFASPMGGGFAAFLDAAVADSVAAATRGQVDRLATFRAATVEPGR